MSENSGIIIYGAGGQGKVVAQVLSAANRRITGFIDDSPGAAGKDILGFPVLGGNEILSGIKKEGAVVAVGDNRVRKEIFYLLKALGFEMVIAVHPFSCIHSSVKIGEGTVILPGVVINADAAIGKNCIVNTCASIDHDCVIADHVHIAPQNALGGGVLVEEESFIGIGCALLPRVKIGRGSIVGGGALVNRDVPDYTVVAGVPAKILRKVEEI